MEDPVKETSDSACFWACRLTTDTIIEIKVNLDKFHNFGFTKVHTGAPENL